VEQGFGHAVADHQTFECALPQPCPAVSWSTEAGATGFRDPRAPACVLQKLRDRAIVAISFDDQRQALDGFGSSETVYILDADHAASNRAEYRDLVTVYRTKNRQILKPASYFDGCMKETDPEAIFACLSDWSMGCADVDVGCPVR
jgi:hypothetical protein